MSSFPPNSFALGAALCFNGNIEYHLNYNKVQFILEYHQFKLMFFFVNEKVWNSSAQFLCLIKNRYILTKISKYTYIVSTSTT